MLPDEFTVKVPVPTLTAPTWMVLASVIAVVNALFLLLVIATTPVKLLPDCVRAMLPLPPMMAPPVVIAPPVWSRLVPWRTRSPAGFVMLPLIVRGPLMVVIETYPETVTGPLTVRPPPVS